MEFLWLIVLVTLFTLLILHLLKKRKGGCGCSGTKQQ